MKKIIVFILALLIAQLAYAKNIEVKTGYGYIKDLSGNIVSKSHLSPGMYPLENGYTYIEVNTSAELNAIQVYAEPKAKSIEEILIEKVTTLESKITKAETDITALKAK